MILPRNAIEALLSIVRFVHRKTTQATNTTDVMHPGRKEAILLFGVSCFITGVLAFGTIRMPIWPFGLLLVFSLAAALAFGYRAVACSDDWFRVQAEKERLWMERHSRLVFAAIIVGALGLLWRIIDQFFISRP